ncbi:MAG: M48 family metallopeptidase [Planctomycetes bacterium]|nr:M48 family metallopeptidase [Planctomycetota bacterium]
MRHLLRPFLFSVLALAPAACANLNLYSDAELEPLSAQAYEEATKDTGGAITSGRDYEMVQRVAGRIAAASDETSFRWEARLLKADDVPNAFCLPNGRIAIYTGILPITQNENGLAVVMGHEVAHAILRHGGKRMTQGTLTQAGLAAVQAGLGMADMSNEARSGVMAALGVGAQVGVLLPFSRDHEREADIEGLRYAIRAGYDPEEAPKLWERMAKLGNGSTPTWLSTHPASEERAQKLREMIPVLREQEKDWRPATPAGGTKKVDPGAVGR